MEIYPNEQRASDKAEQSVIVFLTMSDILSERVDKLTVCWTLYCKQSNASFTSISEFTQTNNSFGMCANVLSHKELIALKNTFDCKAMIGANLTLLSECKGTKKDKVCTQLYPLDMQ